MTFAPDTLKAARNLLLAHLNIHPTGTYPADLDPGEVGIVGDTAHATKGTSYHLGADQLSSTAYSVRTARDKAGLSNAASAVDVGEFRIVTPKGTFTHRHLAIWLVEQCQANAPDTRDIREIIYSPDGKVVLRYDRERGYASEPKPGEADNSHLTHDHFSQYRDAEFRYSLYNLFARWLAHIGLIGEDMSVADVRTGLGQMYDEAAKRDTPSGRAFGDDLKAITGPMLKPLEGKLDELLAQPPVQAAPVDPAALKAVLLDPEVLAAIAKAVADEDHARSAG